mgnify:CR=1 FL=1
MEQDLKPILDVLNEIILPSDERLLEIGSGDGQNAVYFAQAFPRLEWYPTDLSSKLLGMEKLFKEENIHNIKKPQRFDVSKDDFPKLRFDLVFTANTLHLMHWKDCKSLIKLLGHRLREGSRAIFYGPFKYAGEFTSESDKALDVDLKAKDPLLGIRSFEDIHTNMVKNGFELVEDFEMPGSNRLIVFTRLKFVPQR